ncbi:short-chain dehydrogenase [Halobacillus sp. MO56]
MVKGLIYTISLFTLSVLLFYIVNQALYAEASTIAFFLAMIVSHLILEKNQWFIEVLAKEITASKTNEWEGE